jgi:hypothetical protein
MAEHPKVVMGRMRYPDGSEVPPEVEAQVWGKVAEDVDRALVGNLPPEVSDALARLDKETFAQVWPLVRKARLGLLSEDQLDAELRRLGGL